MAVGLVGHIYCMCLYLLCLCALLPPGHPGPSLVTTWLFSPAVPEISHTLLLIACYKADLTGGFS